jgi:hypothetical protein
LQLTYFSDGHAVGGAGEDLLDTARLRLKELDLARHHLVLGLGMTQTAVAAKAPGEDASARVHAHGVIGAAGHVTDLNFLHGGAVVVAPLLHVHADALRLRLAVKTQLRRSYEVLAIRIVPCGKNITK